MKSKTGNTLQTMTTDRSTIRNCHTWPAIWNVAALCGLLSAPHATAATDPAPPPGAGSAPAQSAVSGSDSTAWKPAWLTDASLTIKESYDDNVFMSDVTPADGGATLNDKSSFVTTISPRLGFNFARALGAGGTLESLSLAYAPDFVMYHSLPSENYDAHRVSLAVAGNADAFSYSLENAFTYVDASREAPAYPGNLFNAWATINAYPRREQLQDRSKVTLQYDWNQWFIRPGASLAYYGMMTEIKDPALASTPSGYQNYGTRYDVNGGADAGYKFCPDMAATLGWRYGSQGQEKYSFEAHSSSSDYQRLLLGVEGKPFKWLHMQILGGPDFRSYENIAPVSGHHPVTYYGEASLAATLTPEDTLTFKYKQFRFVSCLGIKPYFDSSYGLSYGRKITDRLSLDVGARLLEADYTVGNLGSCLRDDLDYVLSAGLRFAFSAHVAADLGYSANLGRNAQDNIVNPENRDFKSQEITMGVQVKF
jgi:opacity protein-like surface antigen